MLPPAAAQAFVPVKPAILAPRPVFTPLPTMAQVIVLTARNAALSAQLAAAQAALAAKPSAIAPTTLGQPYTNATGRLFVLHHQMSCMGYGQDPGQIAGNIGGYTNLINEAKAAGADGLSCDYNSDDPTYRQALVNLYAAANLVNAAAGWTPGKTGTVNAKGVGKFSLYVTFDFSSFPENTASILSVLQFTLKDPANLTIGGRPVWSCYTGGGGRSWASLLAIFGPVKSALIAQGITPYGIWGGEPTNPDGSSLSAPNNVTTWATGCVAPIADAVWQFASGQTPLGPSSALPGTESFAQAVHAGGLAFQSSLSPQYGQQSNPNVRFVEDFQGGEGLRAQWRSILDVQKPELGVQGCTADDLDEQTNFLTGGVTPQYVWLGYRRSGVPGYYKDKSGLIADNDNYVQEMKTGQKPVYTSDRIIAQYQTMTGAALTSPTADGPLIVQDDDETVIGRLQLSATNRQVIYVTCYLASTGYITLTQDNGVTVQRIVPAGASTLRLPFVPGSVTIKLSRNNAAGVFSTVLTMTGEPIAATAAAANANNYTMWAHN